MDKKVIDIDNILDDVTQRKIFMGKYSGFQRYDLYKYDFAKKIEEKMRQAFWTPAEISMNTDRIKFKELPEHSQEQIIQNLLFQTTMDSVQSRGLEMVLCELTTSPEWESVFKTQAFFEQIHSISYSHIIRDVFSNATEIFDRIGSIPEITKRLEKEATIYNFFSTDEYKQYDSNRQKEFILELVLRIYFLEALKFYVSFLVTYIINANSNSSIQGITKIIKLINFDEDMHVSVMAGLLSILKKNKDEGFQYLFETGWAERKAKEILTEIVEDEINWGNHLLSLGNIPSLTPKVFELFVKWWANERMRKLKMKELYNNIEKIDLIDWFNMYRDIDKENVAQQEAESLAYNIGIMKNDIPVGKLDV